MPGHLYVPSLTWPDQMTVVSSVAEESVKMVVAIQKGHSTVAHPVSTSKYDGFQRDKVYFKPDGSKYTGMGGEEYKDIVDKQIVCNPSRRSHAGVQTRSSSTVLVHDNDRAHTSKVFQEYAATTGLEVKRLPPHSPDLSPLDSGFFGTVKTSWRKERIRKRLGWDESVVRFKELVEAENPAPYIDAWAGRLRDCKACHGWHFKN